LSNAKLIMGLPGAAWSMMGFAEFIIGPAKCRTWWLNPPYACPNQDIAPMSFNREDCHA
jgi:hypothetical protein